MIRCLLLLLLLTSCREGRRDGVLAYSPPNARAQRPMRIIARRDGVMVEILYAPNGKIMSWKVIGRR